MQHKRVWITDDGAEHSTKAEAEKHEAKLVLQNVIGTAPDANTLIVNAEEVISLLKTFVPPKARAPKANGASKKAPKKAKNDIGEPYVTSP